MEHDLDPEVRLVAERYLEALDDPLALSVAIQLRYGDFGSIAARRVDPHQFNSPQKFSAAYKAAELLRKYPGLPLEVDRKGVAIDSFWASEAQCCRTNLRLNPYIHDPASGDCDVRILEFIQRVKRRVRHVLGSLPSDLDIKFGPGAVFESKGTIPSHQLVLGDKLQLGIFSTPEASDLVSHYVYPTAWGRALVSEFPSRSGITFVRGNRFTTVPKDALKDRGICVEPGANVALQLSVGSHIRRRLAERAGIDLKTGQAWHGKLAQRAASSGKLATIDLSNASDTVSSGLVRLLLPCSWFRLLDSLRSKTTEIEGRVVHLQKFSSMGNGFTFELETLLFWAIAREVCEDENVSCYGDDIIVPRSGYDDVVSCLRFFGFTPNPRKSFGSSYFRESCGTDVFDKVVIQPFRFDKVPSSPADWISVHNGVRRSLGPYQGRDVLRAVVKRIPAEIRYCRGPEHLGDLVIHDSNVANWDLRLRNSVRYVRVWKPVPHKVGLTHFRAGFQLALLLYGSPSDGLHPRAVGGYRKSWVPYS